MRPDFGSGTPFYGQLPFGLDQNIGVMFSVIHADEFNGVTGQVLIGTKADGQAYGGEILEIQPWGIRSEEFVVSVDYGEETAFFTFTVLITVWTISSENPSPGFSTDPEGKLKYFFTAVLRTDTVMVAQVPGTSNFFLISSDRLARFDTPQTSVLQDLDGDGYARETIRGEVQNSTDATIFAEGAAWRIVGISASGRKISISPAGKGILSGKVRTFVGANGIEGATIRIWPGPFETVSKPDGTYNVEVYAGEIWKVEVAKEGLTPYSYYNQVTPEKDLIIRRDRTTTLDIELAEIPETSSGTANLSGRGSFNGVFGRQLSDESVGDFSYGITQLFELVYEETEGGRPAPPSVKLTEKKFTICACYEGQLGVIELGDYLTRPLDEIPIPPVGFLVQKNLEVKAGFVYSSKARTGLPGRFVVFRVDSISDNSIAITYIFR